MHKPLLTLAAGFLAAAFLSGTAQAAEGEKPAAKEPKTHVVAPGDSLSSIAESHQLESWKPLWNVNPEVSNPDVIYANQKLIVPEGPTTDRPLPVAAVAAPVQQPAVQTSYQAPRAQVAPRAANYAAGSGGLFASIRQKESGGNYATNTGNGYYGAYQFDLGTWRSVGGSGLPSDASPAEQDMRAQMLYDRRGCSPWPNTCN
jgi:LysM repeat protein